MIEEKGKKTCRFYENEYPAEDDLVMGEIVEVDENATYVDLLEYPGKRGMITPSEYTKYMMRVNVLKAMRRGKHQVVRVIRVDKDKGYIDLSKKKVDKQQEIEFADKFAKSKTIYSIMRTLAQDRHTDVETMFKLVAWPLYRETPQPLQILIQSMNDQSRLDKLNLDEPTKAKLMSEIRRRFQPKCVKIMSTFEISINDFEGINILKDALTLGKKKSKPEFNIDITILGAPVYLISLETDKEVEGMQLIKDALDEIKKHIEVKNGSFKIKDAPKVIGDKNAHLELYEQANKQEDDANSNSSGMGNASDND